MPQLTKYNSYEALKASKNHQNTNEQLRAERNAALEHFVELLRDSLKDKEQSSKPITTDDSRIGQANRNGLCSVE